MKFRPDFGSHLSVLIPLVQKTGGDVLELGMGFSSTFVLHELCRGRKLVSYENNPRVFEMFRDFTTGDHEIHLIDDWDKVPIEHPWSVALIDHSPARRRRHELMRLKPWADFIVVHDTEPEMDRFYRIQGRIKRFEYVKHNDLLPRTTVLSDHYFI